MHELKLSQKLGIFKSYNRLVELQGVFVIYRLTGTPVRSKNADLPPGQAGAAEGEAALPPREIELTHVPLYELQRIFHAGPNNRLLERRHVNEEKASRLQAFCSEQIDTQDYQWEFSGRWSDGI
jgi:hypothetical protein